MPLALLGSAGIGLVWGWLAGRLEGRIRKPLRTWSAVVGATAAVGAPVLAFSGWQGVAAFGSAMLLAFLAHVTWRRGLRAHLV